MEILMHIGFLSSIPANIIKPIFLSLKRIWQTRLRISLGWIWVLHVYIKNLTPLSLISLLFLLVGVFLSLLNLMVMILVQLGNTLVNIYCSLEMPVSMMLCVCVYFFFLFLFFFLIFKFFLL